MKVFMRTTVAALFTALATAAAAQFPEKPVRIVVPYPAGGGVDFVGRTLAQKLGEAWGQTVTVENRAGASGTIGADVVAKSNPDGLTLLLASPAEVLVGPIAGQKTPYNPEKDLVPVALAGETPLAIVAHPSTAGADLKAVISAGKGSTLSYGTPGAGSSMHFAGEALNKWSGASMVHVPYRGAAPAVNDALGNQVPLVIVGMPPIVAHAKSGKLKVLAVTTAKRSPTLPDVPTVAEIPGMSDYRFSNWMMILAPAGTPEQVVAKIGADVAKIVQDPAIQKRLNEAGVEPAGLTGASLRKFMDEERQRYAAIAKERNVRAAP